MRGLRELMGLRGVTSRAPSMLNNIIFFSAFIICTKLQFWLKAMLTVVAGNGRY